ncbi:tetratricopeptide repeat protein [Nocardia callitridis]|uniref:Tetratricopeptide repeat protein n=1 Tax=Nocardia callitridis TaxID=648753 RepID=A0ABP9K5F9_9NOCA
MNQPYSSWGAGNSTQDQSLAERYRSADPITWHGTLVYPMYTTRIGPVPTVVTVKLVSAAPPPGLRSVGIGLSVVEGYVDLNGRRLPGVDAWSDALVGGGAGIEVTPTGPGTLVTLTPVWVDGFGVHKSWVGNYGMVIENTQDGRIVLWCSIGEGPANFANLVAEVHTTPAVRAPNVVSSLPVSGEFPAVEDLVRVPSPAPEAPPRPHGVAPESSLPQHVPAPVPVESAPNSPATPVVSSTPVIPSAPAPVHSPAQVEDDWDPTPASAPNPVVPLRDPVTQLIPNTPPPARARESGPPTAPTKPVPRTERPADPPTAPWDRRETTGPHTAPPVSRTSADPAAPDRPFALPESAPPPSTPPPVSSAPHQPQSPPVQYPYEGGPQTQFGPGPQFAPPNHSGQFGPASQHQQPPQSGPQGAYAQAPFGMVEYAPQPPYPAPPEFTPPPQPVAPQHFPAPQYGGPAAPPTHPVAAVGSQPPGPATPTDTHAPTAEYLPTPAPLPPPAPPPKPPTPLHSRPPEDRGYRSALYDLGVAMYARGEGDEALGLWTQAADRGHAGAAHDLGVVSLERGDIAGAQDWLRLASDRRDTRAMLILADLLDHLGNGDEANFWRVRADEQQDFDTAAS